MGVGESDKGYKMLKHSIQVLLLIVPVLLMQSCRKDEIPDKPDLAEGDFKVVAYIPGWGDIDFSAIQAEKLTHVNYAFINVKDGKVYSEMEQDSVILRELVGLKNVNPDLKVLVSVGGATWSGEFSDVAFTDSSRNVFSESITEFILKYQLDGVDLDWEFPGYGDGSRPEDKENFTFLLQNLRSHLNMLELTEMRSTDDPYLLTIAAGSSEWLVNLMELNEVVGFLDFINVMTYDFKGGWSSVTGHHTNLYPSNHDPGSKFSASESVKLYLSYGVSPEKIMMGAAFYGRWWSGVTKQNNGLYQSYSGGAGALTYAGIYVGYLSDPDFKRYWDDKALAPYLWSNKYGIFITYDDPASIRYKAEYIRNKGIGGIMFWEYSQDYNGSLLNAITQGFE